MFTAQAGTIATIIETFFDDFEVPLIPKTSPIVTLYDTDKTQIYQTTALIGTLPGEWSADLAIPKMDNMDSVQLKAVWRFKDDDGIRHRVITPIVVEPAIDIRPSDCVALYGDLNFSITVPYLASNGDTMNPKCNYTLYSDNDLLFDYAADNSAINYMQHLSSTDLQFPLTVSYAKMQPRMLLARRTLSGRLSPEMYTFKLWVVTPQVLNAASLVESYINKSRIANVIPELQYATSDLLQALKAGLDIYNSFPPYGTSFDGTNMQGVLLESWLICSAYQLLNMQYMAEGSLAFDFSGQSVSLNIDRTQYIESMLGRLQEEIENTVKPAKKLVVKAGIVGGDGSAGAKLGGYGKNFGLTSLINAPTTRLRTMNSTFRRYW